MCHSHSTLLGFVRQLKNYKKLSFLWPGDYFWEILRDSPSLPTTCSLLKQPATRLAAWNGAGQQRRCGQRDRWRAASHPLAGRNHLWATSCTKAPAAPILCVVDSQETCLRWPRRYQRKKNIKQKQSNCWHGSSARS